MVPVEGTLACPHRPRAPDLGDALVFVTPTQDNGIGFSVSRYQWPR